MMGAPMCALGLFVSLAARGWIAAAGLAVRGTHSGILHFD